MMLTKINKQLLPTQPIKMNYQRKKDFKKVPGKLTPIQSMMDFQNSIAPQERSFGCLKTGKIDNESKLPTLSMRLLQRENCKFQNAFVRNDSAKVQSSFLTSDATYSRENETNKMQSKAARLHHLKSHASDEKDALNEEYTQDDKLRQKMIVVAKWIIDCERAKKKEKRKHELADFKCPWWMKTAMERRCNRIRRRDNKGGHGLGDDISEENRKFGIEKEWTKLGTSSECDCESIIGRYLDAGGSGVFESDREAVIKMKGKIPGLLADEVKVTGANVAQILDKALFVTWCFEYDKRVGNKMYQNVKLKNFKGR